MSDRFQSLVRLLVLVVGLAGSITTAAAGETLLTVPFLPQTEALCGGAAAAMVYRYWGDTHADAQQFAPLVDRRAGGIRDTALTSAILNKGWQAAQPPGSLMALRAALDAKQPVILLIEDRRSTYHFVVAVGISDSAVVVHDPTWGPNRRLTLGAFTRVWAAAQSWMLVVTPGANMPRRASAAPAAAAVSAPTVAPSRCDQAIDAALNEIDARGLSAADMALAAARQACPGDARPLRELAGVRLAQSRMKEAAALARKALQLDGSDRYAWDVLGSSLFLQEDMAGALDAWNQVGKPQLDSVQIRGLERSRYALIAATTGLTPSTLLSSHDFERARRRLEQLPDRVSSRLWLEPAADGYATVNASLQETSRTPRGLVPWAAAGAQTAINREIVADIAGWSGQGEVWSGSWRWWENRPRVAMSFAAPRAGRLGGIWRLDAAWEAQTYDTGEAGPRREDRRTGLLSFGDWLTGTTRVELRSGLDTWDSSRRAIVTGGTIEQRLFGDRLTLIGGVDRWHTFGGARPFTATSTAAIFRSSRQPRGFVTTAMARVDSASDAAPLALWSGAGEGRGRPGLLRAHRMLYDGIVDAAIFGRRSGVSNLELQRWFTTELAAVGIAGFADLGAATHRLAGAQGKAFQADAGMGIRARVPGQPGTFRLDYARGLVDGANRISTGWSVYVR